MPSLTRKIVEGVTVIFFSTLILHALGTLVAVILIRSLGMYEYGLLTLALSAFAISSLFLNFGGDLITTDISREIGKQRLDRAKNILINFAKIQMLVSFILFFVVFFSSGTIAARYNKVVGELVKIWAFLLIPAGIKNIFGVTFRSQLKFKSLSIMQTMESVIQLILVLWFILLMKKGVVGAIFTYPLSLLGGILLVTPLFIKHTKQFRELKKAEGNLFLDNLKTHGKWVIATDSLKTLVGNARPWLIQFFLGVEVVAIYEVAKKALEFVISLVPLRDVLTPIVSQEVENLEKIQKIVFRSLKYSLVLSLPLSLLAFITAPFVFGILFPAYSASVSIFRIIILAAIINSFTIFQGPLFYALKAQKYLFYLQIFSLFSIGILASIFIYLFGLIGIALEFVFTNLFIAIFLYICMKKIVPEIKLDLRNLLVYDDYDKTFFKKIITKIKK